MTNTSRSTATTRRQSSIYRRKRLRRRKLIRRTIFSCLAILVIATVVFLAITFLKFSNTHFSKNTTINEIDCSWLTPEEAYYKLNEHLSERNVSFIFEDNTYSFTGSDFDLKINSVDTVEIFLDNQKTGNKQTTFTLDYFSINTTKLKEIMKSISNFNEENMVCSQDAYITLSDENLLTIVPEVVGNYINFDEAYSLAFEAITAGNTVVDLCSLTSAKPQITSENLQEIATTINNVLNTTVTFDIGENYSLTLNKNVMKDWLVVDEFGNYSIDIDSNLPVFINQLAEKCSSSTVYIEFEATGLGKVSVPAKNLSIDKEAEFNRIKSELGSATDYTYTPLYNINIGGTYVEIDIARQHVWLYQNGVCIMETDCVTGNKGNHDTREGYFFLTSKETDRILRGYNDNGTKYASHVDFWMPFDGGIGLHDAAWRYGVFGGDIYVTNGSHGCVNLPRSAAEKIYNTIDFSTPIIVYCSTK